MPVLTMDQTIGDLLKREFDRDYCRDVVTLAAGVSYKAGSVLGRAAASVVAGDVTVTARVGNTGNGAFTKDPTNPVLAGAQPGNYAVVIIEPATNLGTFIVIAPDGHFVGVGVVGTAFANEIAFTIADGTPDFASGDSWTVTVPAGTGVWELAQDSKQPNGSNVAAGVLLFPVDATGGAKPGVVVRRGPAILSSRGLIYHSSVDTTPKKASKIADLLAAGLVVASA